MKHGKWKPLCLLALALCLLAATACAEKMTLAFGYEIDLPEGVEITGEAWTPENHALMYLLTGTYQNGVEQFRLRVNYGFEHQLKTGKEYAGSINVSIEDIWVWLETTTSVQKYVDSTDLSLGRKVQGKKTELYERVSDELFALGISIASASAQSALSQTEQAKDTVAVHACTLDFGYGVS